MIAADIGPGDLAALVHEGAHRVACDLNTGCWLWSTNLTKGGYGRVSLGGRKTAIYAHRAAYMAYVGPLQDHDVVCHRCDTPACCNPSHLFVGSQTDNMQDAYRKGRLNPIGDCNRIKAAVVAEVKAGLLAGAEGQALAKIHGISVATVSAIKNGRRWQDVQPKPDAFTDLLKAPDRQRVSA